MKRRWKILIALLLVLPSLIGIALAVLHVGSESEVDVYKQSLLARGEKLEIAEVLPPPVPPEQNGADLVRQAMSILGKSYDDSSNFPPAMCIVAPGKAMIGFAQPDARYLDITNTWANLEAVVAYDRPATELLKQAMNFPALDFRVDYSQGPETPLPHLAPLKYCARRLSAEAICDLNRGDPAAAVTNIYALLALVRSWHDERTFISQVERESLALIAANATWELLQATNLNDEALARLQKDWERTEYLHATENSFSMERASREMAIKKMRVSPQYFHDEFGSDNNLDLSGDWGDAAHNLWNYATHDVAAAMWHVSWTYSDELQMLQNDQLALEAIRTIETNGYYYPIFTNTVKRLDDIVRTHESPDWADNLQWPFTEDGEWIGNIIGDALAAQTVRNLTLTAIALKRYQLQHGNYPPDLNSLVPEFMSTIPSDPIDGQPLRYRLNTDDNFLLYSIGLNNQDDGGDASLDPHHPGNPYRWLDRASKDWVWPQPATPAEIQSFYDHPPH